MYCNSPILVVMLATLAHCSRENPNQICPPSPEASGIREAAPPTHIDTSVVVLDHQLTLVRTEESSGIVSTKELSRTGYDGEFQEIRRFDTASTSRLILSTKVPNKLRLYKITDSEILLEDEQTLTNIPERLGGSGRNLFVLSSAQRAVWASRLEPTATPDSFRFGSSQKLPFCCSVVDAASYDENPFLWVLQKSPSSASVVPLEWTTQPATEMPLKRDTDVAYEGEPTALTILSEDIGDDYRRYGSLATRSTVLTMALMAARRPNYLSITLLTAPLEQLSVDRSFSLHEFTNIPLGHEPTQLVAAPREAADATTSMFVLFGDSSAIGRVQIDLNHLSAVDVEESPLAYRRGAFTAGSTWAYVGDAANPTLYVYSTLNGFANAMAEIDLSDVARAVAVIKEETHSYPIADGVFDPMYPNDSRCGWSGRQ